MILERKELEREREGLGNKLGLLGEEEHGFKLLDSDLQLGYPGLGSPGRRLGGCALALARSRSRQRWRLRSAGTCLAGAEGGNGCERGRSDGRGGVCACQKVGGMKHLPIGGSTPRANLPESVELEVAAERRELGREPVGGADVDQKGLWVWDLDAQLRDLAPRDVRPIRVWTGEEHRYLVQKRPQRCLLGVRERKRITGPA